jgi:hypothetical protein
VREFLTVALNDATLLDSVFASLHDCHTHQTETLEVSTVPKSFKAVRVICPDTVLGGFLSRGLGKLIQKKLKLSAARIDITTAQEKHKRLAQKGSVTGNICTIDMSKASDSFVWEHIERLMPKSWHKILKVIRTGSVKVAGHGRVELQSYMLMGSGHTFPLQTLLFWAMTKAVVELMGSEAPVSVYGDDIIAPARYSRQIIVSLNKLGFVINREKSFVEGDFRESCGGDYYAGVDVRPFLPEHTTDSVERLELLALLHTWANGLTERWNLDDVPRTYAYLVNLAATLDRKGKVCKSDNDAPDYAGFRQLPFESWGRISCKWDKDLQRPVFRSLTMRRQKRDIRNGHAYFWRWLHTRSLPDYLAGDPYSPEWNDINVGTFGSEGRKGCAQRYRERYS